MSPPCPSRHSPPPGPLSPELPDDLVLEILLRIPPDRPEALVRASCVSKAWRGALSDPAFCRRHREFHHRTPPLLGYLRSERMPGLVDVFRATTFVPSTAIRPATRGRPWHDLLDARRGHVLLEHRGLLVWNPITEISHRVPWPPNTPCLGAEFAVLCGCGDRGCHGGHFLVVFGYQRRHRSAASAAIYSSRDGVGGAWSDMTSSVELPAAQSDGALMKGRSVLVGNTCYMPLRTVIMEYNTVDRDLKVITLPPSGSGYRGRIYMSAEDGTLGLAALENSSSRLCLWSRKAAAGANGALEWAQQTVIELNMPPSVREPEIILADYSDAGVGAVFIRTENGLFRIELGSSDTVREISSCEGDLLCRIPYRSFYTLVNPACPSRI